MKTKYYKSGLRPVFQEIEDEFDTYYAFQWETGEFEENMEYGDKIDFDPDGDVEELTKEEFDTYVKQLREERGLDMRK